jgi:hypothetical protein
MLSLNQVDSHPTVTRFFTFRGNVDRMLSMHLIRMPPNVIRLTTTKPQEENKKRLSLVHGFFSHAEAPQELRRASLVLQMTGGVEALTARKPRSGAEPVMVSLVKGAAQEIVVTRLRRLLGAMHLDDTLEPGAAACVLLLTAADMFVRFGVFFLYPFKLALLCRAWFPSTWYQHVFAFLHEVEGKLDVGVGLELQRLAWGQGGESLALGWLSSAPVQRFIHQLCEEALASSLPVERRLGEVKQWETSRSTNIATASRNMLIVRYAKQRERLAQDLAAAMQKFRRAQRTNLQSLTFCGLTSTSFQVAPTPQKKLCTERPTPQKKLCTAREHGARADGARAEGEQGLAASKEALLAKAEAEVEDILSKCDLPITRLQWAAWLDDHIVEFHGRMKTDSVRRRALNTRVRARENLPEPAVRLHPKSGAKAKYTTQWAANLAGRCGWHGL